MESTACGKECPFVKQGFCESDKQCPNYIETWWQKGQDTQPVKLCDCSPKRMVLQQQVMQAKFECVQQSLEQSRNQYAELTNYLKNLIETSKQIILQKDLPYEKLLSVEHDSSKPS